MTQFRSLESYLSRYRIAVALVYVALVLVLALTTTWSVLDLDQRYRALAASKDTLTRLQARGTPRVSEGDWNDRSVPQGSPFLDGQTVTVASAVLLQRVSSAITRVGGVIVSSEVEPRDPKLQDGFVTISANCELEQPALQQLLYDVEAGMPFLFVDQFTAEASTSEDDHIRVLLKVSALWLAMK
jgi:general secretion pathway protein M